jgi:hypothetical protein
MCNFHLRKLESKWGYVEEIGIGKFIFQLGGFQVVIKEEKLLKLIQVMTNNRMMVVYEL